MNFPVHNFEVKSSPKNRNFAFHETLSEGHEIYFLGNFENSIQNPDAIAEEIFGTAIDHIKQSKISNTYDKFEEALKVVNLNTKQALDGKKPDIIMAYFEFNQLFLTQSGKSESYLVRDHSVSQISEGGEDDDDLFLNILSGEVNLNDTIILSSKRLLRSITTNEVVQIFARENFEESCDQLEDILEQKNTENISVTCIGIGKKENTNAAGFLSKMVKKGNEIIASTKTEKIKQAPTPTPLMEDIPSQQETEPIENQNEELFEAQKPLVANNIPPRKKPMKSPITILDKTPDKKKMLLIAGIVFGILILILFFRFISNIESSEKKELKEQIDIAYEALQQADTFLLQGERTSAQEYLEKALQSAQNVAKSKSKIFRSDVGLILAQIEQKQLQVENAKKVTPNLVTDLSLKNDNLESLGLLELRGNLYVNDSKKVFKTVSNVVEKGVPLSEKETIIAKAAQADQSTLVYLSDAPRLIEYKEGVITPMNTADESWKSGVDIQTYGRYVYVLDPVENQIWKYERRRTNYSSAGAYSDGADLSRAVSLSIDGSIYVLTDDGNIKKLFRGKETEFSFRELPSTPFEGKNLKLSSSADLDFIYVLDPDNQRVLVFVKGDRYATYKKQVLYGDLDARDFVIDESGQKVYLLTKDKVYTFAL